MANKVLLIDNVHPIIPKTLIREGFEIIDAINFSRSQIISILNDACGLIIRSRIIIDSEIIDAAPQLKFIARVGAGMESIDTEYCKSKGIICLNSPEGNRDAVGEHATGMLLSLLNKLNKVDSEVKSGIWLREENRGTELGNKTVGIIGYGNTGSSFARKISGFGCRVISYDKYKTEYTDGFTTEVSLQTIFDESDILSLHVPLTEETYYMIDDEFIKQFSKNLYLINTARGTVVKTSALVNAIKSGKITGAGLDVLEYEESSFEETKSLLEIKDFNFLTKCDNVMLSPHIAGWTVESKIKLAQVLVDKIKMLNL
jgi:D-3-phosphoglycerate dehydrogenase